MVDSVRTLQVLKDARQLETVKEAIKAADELTEIEELLKGIQQIVAKIAKVRALG